MVAKGVVVVPSTSGWRGPLFGATRANSLQRVANRPILCHVLDALREADVVEAAVIAPAAEADEIAAAIRFEGPPGVAVSHFVRAQTDDANDVLQDVAEFVGYAPCILHRADGLLGQPVSSFVELLRDESPDALLLVQERCADERRLRLVIAPSSSGSEVEPMSAAGIAGVCLLGPGAMQYLPGRQCDGQLLDFAALVEQLARNDGRVQLRVVRKWRHFTGDALDLLDMNRMLLDSLEAEASASAQDRNRFEGPIAIHPTAQVSSSVIIGPVVIGADTVITDAYIGPHTSIAERVRIEGAELERSIVLADARVLHVGARLVASVVGRGARIFRDFSMPRALRLQVSDGDEVALC
jgi:glucose-1-phosphate thymidylyltransferase